MITRKSNHWELNPYKVHYIQREEEIEQWALPNKQWWRDFEEKWEHTEIIEFKEIEVTDDMKERYEEIKNMPEDFFEIYVEYILTGDISDDVELPINHPFNIVRLRNEGKKLDARGLFHDDLIAELAKEIYK